MKFDTTYYNQLQGLDEGKFESLAAAGLIAAAGAPQMASGAVSTQPPSTSMSQAQASQDGVILSSIIDHTAFAEGFREMVYKDTKKIPTIGYGTNLKEQANLLALKQLGYDTHKLLNGSQTIKKEDAKKLLKSGLQTALNDAKEYLPNFDSQPLKVKCILTDMSYNLGGNTLNKFGGLRSALMSNNYVKAKQQMVKSHWYKQVGNRSKKLVDMLDDVIQKTS